MAELFYQFEFALPSDAAGILCRPFWPSTTSQEMSSEKEQNVPVWDGSARSWRRYTREVCWYVRATPVEKRRYCATKLVGKLRGPARLLAMSWTTMEFDHVNGVRDLLQRLAASPLVRRTLPNAAATCQQYF